jgi:hypothetical protein
MKQGPLEDWELHGQNADHREGKATKLEGWIWYV